MEMQADEGAFPDTAENLEAHQKKTLIKQAEFWLKMHDVYERAAKVFVDIKNWMAHQEVPREPDERRYTQEEVRFLMDMTRRENRRPAPNGDMGIPLWQLIISAAGVMLTIAGMWSHLSDKITTQGVTMGVALSSLAESVSGLKASVSDIKEKQREEDERTTRVEQELRELAGSRWNARPNP